VKITVGIEKDGSFYVVDPESGRRYTGVTQEEAIEYWKQRGLTFEVEDLTPEATTQAILEFMKMGMKFSDIINRMVMYGTDSYEPNTFEGTSNRTMIECMRTACFNGLADASLSVGATDLFDVMKHTSLIIPKSFEVLANIPLTTAHENKAYWILKDSSGMFTLIQAWRGSALQWHFAEHRTTNIDAIWDHVPEHDSGVYVRLNLDEQYKKKSPIGTYSLREYTI